MTQPSDNELDKLAREAAEQHDPAGAAPDWVMLRHDLDREMPLVASEPHRRRWVLFLLLLVAGSIVTWSLLRDNDQLPVAEASPTSDNKTGRQADNGQVTANSSTNGTGQTPAATSIPNIQQAPTPAATSSPATRQGQTQSNRVAKNMVAEPQSANSTRETSHTTNNADDPADLLIPARATTSRKQTPAAARAQENNTHTEPTELHDTAVSENVKHVSTTLQPSVITKAKASDTTVSPLQQKNTTAKKEVAPAEQARMKQQASASHSRFEVTVLYAPELTSVNWTNIEKPGSNYGLLLGYRFTKRFTVQAGAVRSRKNYAAEGKDYTNTYTPQPPYKLKTVRGYCEMIELPLNLRVLLSETNSFRVYGLAGVSSYLLEKESYTFRYASNYSSYTYAGNYEDKQHYWLSSLTIGAGLEKDLAPAVSVSMYPFLKMPLTGMGRGKLKMQSAGINFQLAWRPFRR